MCGIVAVVRRPSTRSAPTTDEVLAPLDAAVAAMEGPGDELTRLGRVAPLVESCDRLLRGQAGLEALLADRTLSSEIAERARGLLAEVESIERSLDEGTAGAGSSLEAMNAAIVRCKDALWSLCRDRLRTADAVADLAGPDVGRAGVAAYLSVQQTLSALDRLEVRGRDSAGLHLLVVDHGLDLESPSVAAEVIARSIDPVFGSGSVRVVDGMVSFVYKAAAEIGELGDNTRVLRDAVRADELLRRALLGPDVRVVVLSHTRWASIGIISQANAHPLNSEEIEGDQGTEGTDRPYAVGVLNGDVDNFADLKASEGLRIADDITTDAKVIPTLTSRRAGAGVEVVDAFRRTANLLEGSVAVALSSTAEPDDLLLALRGSGQALYVGVAEDTFVVASEPYGVVEETDRYLRMDGETPADPTNPASAGQIVRLRGALAGTVDGIERQSYDGSALAVTEDELATAQITTRDIDRGDNPHYLLKEIAEAPGSFRKTLRGKLVEVDGSMTVALGDDVLPAELRQRLSSGEVRRVIGIGQGTAAVAAQSFASALDVMVGGAPLRCDVMPATELSGFGLLDDMSDTVVVAISQSGTTTDTNRTVDLVRARGGTVVAIVNRRNSDLTDKADGVLYTSDGRDVEMSVASTKAFYSQIAAGFLLAAAMADAVGVADDADRQDLLQSLRELPTLMERTLEVRPSVAEAARRFAPSRRYWALVGNGPNRIAANEVRIKLSELCYKSMACDATEDKKHIDLSSEPLILVCAAGLVGSTADDVAKEVAIYRAHKAAPIVIASEGDERFTAAVHAIVVPATHPRLAFVLSAMAGHLFGYEAALAIDAQAHPLREARAAVERVVASGADEVDAGDHLLTELRPDLEPAAVRFFDGLRSGEYDGHLEASTASRLASLLRYALGVAGLDAYQMEYGKVGTPSVVVEDLTDGLTRAIEELTRPVDAIKHQAKTVTVGISRSDETLLQVPLVRSVLDAGVARDRLTYESLRSLANLEPVVAEVLGYTRYRIDGRLDGPDEPHAVVVDRGGLGRELRSRTEHNPVLRGTKRRVAVERRPVLARGAADGRTVLIVPEIKDNQPTGITLLHVELASDLNATVLRSVLEGYRDRYSSLVDAVVETEPSFRNDLLASVPVVELMTAPIADLAAHWRSS
ncbi:MAG: SIS domain-containing protein [Acidimicrobiia bacterium]|nr:SIS domain-containing protein [Acidimicrobiia bacterium]